MTADALRQLVKNAVDLAAGAVTSEVRAAHHADGGSVSRLRSAEQNGVMARRATATVRFQECR